MESGDFSRLTQAAAMLETRNERVRRKEGEEDWRSERKT
jgi:hypothetical protein